MRARDDDPSAVDVDVRLQVGARWIRTCSMSAASCPLGQHVHERFAVVRLAQARTYVGRCDVADRLAER